LSNMTAAYYTNFDFLHFFTNFFERMQNGATGSMLFTPTYGVLCIL